MSARIEKTIDLNAPLAQVWRAVTDHNEFGQWFGVKLDGPFKLGEVSTGHITSPGYEHIKWEATVERMEAMHLFSYSWHPYAIDPAVDYSGEVPTLVEFRLEPIPGGTRLTIVETGFDALPADRKLVALHFHETGWTEQLANIQAYIDS